MNVRPALFRHSLAAGLALALPSAPATAQAPAQVTDQAAAPPSAPAANQAPVRALIDAMAAGDADRIRAQFAPEATQAYGADGRMKTPAATARWLETDIIERQGKVADPVFTTEGDTVVVRGQYSSRGYTSKADFLFTVKDGRITSWRMRY